MPGGAATAASPAAPSSAITRRRLIRLPSCIPYLYGSRAGSAASISPRWTRVRGGHPASQEQEELQFCQRKETGALRRYSRQARADE
jgi:hypothetical protein